MIQVRLLGQFDIRLDKKRITIPSRIGQSLFALLVMAAGTPQRREKLAATFWPDVPDENARRNLRQELWRIRKAISGQQSNGDDYLLADEFTITFNRNTDYWLDVFQVEKPDVDLESLTSNLSVYQGEFLPGFYDDWIMLERERILSIFDTKMEQLLGKLIAAERWTAVQEQAERWLTLGNALEPAYRALMLAYGGRGDMAKVSFIYQRCIDTLSEQFGLEPSAETRALYDGLIQGAHVSSRATVPSSGIVTFLFTDIEESTNLLGKLGNQYATVLAEHHQILRDVIQKWNGREVDTQGDAFFVTFARSLDAVQCAAEAQRAFASHKWSYDQPVRVRMGLHTGEQLIASTGYAGMDVHRAARIGDAAHGGQVLLSQTTRELIIHDLPNDLKIRDLGEHRLKDLKFPTPIYQLIIEGLQQEFPPLRTKFSGTEAPTPGEPPFKGLQYFDEVDADLFFGREVLTAKLVKRLHETQFLSVIVGASGSGKSSLVRAGLIPALKRDRSLIDGGANWQVHILAPTAHPLEALAVELTRDSKSVTTTATLINDLMQDPRSLALYLARQNPKRRTLLVLDQFEELFTLCRDEFEREAFIDNLLTTIHSTEPNLTLIITLRADFYAHLAQYPELRDAVAQQQEYIGPMTMEELRRAIEEPAKCTHWTFEPGLVDLILRDVGEEPGALPLLSHALLETWHRRAGHTLTLKGYADAGGVRGAIAHTAETVYQNLSTNEQSIAHNIFLRLTELGEGTEDTRRRTSYEELITETENTDEVRTVLNVLAKARLITLNQDTAEVAHEALIREWPTLREWLNQDRDGLKLHRHLTGASHEWELLERDAGVLYRGARLPQAREWAALHPNALNEGERAFLDASTDQEQREEREREEQRQRELEAARKLAETERVRAEEQAHSANRLRIRNRVITSVGSIAVSLALLAGMFGIQANRNAVQAQSNFRQAEAQRLASEANRVLLGGGNPELIALLSLRSMNTQYTPQGDSALTAASRLNYPEQIIPGPRDAWSLAISPDGKYIVIGRLDHSVRLYDVKTGKELRQFVGHTGGVINLAYSPDGKYIVSTGFDQTVRVWDAATGQQVRQFTWDTQGESAVAFSPNGRYVLGGPPAIWDITTGLVVRQFVNNSGTGESAAFSHDGKSVLTGNVYGIVQQWDVQTGQELRRFTGHKGGVVAVRFSSDDKLVLTGGQDGTARLWDAGTGKELQIFTGHTANLDTVAFSPDSKYAFTASNDDTARVWDITTGQELGRFPCPASVRDVASSPDGKSIWTISDDGMARSWSIKPRAELPVFQDGSVVNGVAISHDGKLILTGDMNGIARVWNANTGQLLREFKGHTDAINYGVAFSQHDRKVVTGSWDRTVRIWDIATGRELYRFTGHTDGVNTVAFSPDGKYIITGGEDGARIWDPETGQEVRQLSGVSKVYGVVFSPDGKYIATGSNTEDGTALWDAHTGKMLHRFTGTTRINSVAFSRDGKYLLSTDHKGIGWLWDVQTGKMVRQFVGHTDVISGASYSPDGKYVATASYDGTARLWDVQTGQELRRFTGHRSGVENVVFSPDGKYILTGSDDGTAMLWDVDYHTTMQYLCSTLLRDFTYEDRAQYNITDTTPTCPKP